MSTHLKDRLEKIHELIAKLASEAAKGKPIVVEGKKDAHALAELGINGAILTLKTGGKSFLEAAGEIEALGVGEVVLLMDYDRRGREATKRLQQDLERAHVKVNVRFWRELHGLVGRDVQCIESLPGYLATAQQKAAL
ncbi:MAG: toprim domain-containing protein [Candidatus Bathyarchaeota archaeon]|nr:toprim domain-containing protein [Candidatus Bathyarchaeota archaeon]